LVLALPLGERNALRVDDVKCIYRKCPANTAGRSVRGGREAAWCSSKNYRPSPLGTRPITNPGRYADERHRSLAEPAYTTTNAADSPAIGAPLLGQRLGSVLKLFWWSSGASRRSDGYGVSMVSGWSQRVKRDCRGHDRHGEQRQLAQRATAHRTARHGQPHARTTCSIDAAAPAAIAAAVTAA
jgi:hypothetical protein